MRSRISRRTSTALSRPSTSAGASLCGGSRPTRHRPASIARRVAPAPEAIPSVGPVAQACRRTAMRSTIIVFIMAVLSAAALPQVPSRHQAGVVFRPLPAAAGGRETIQIHNGLLVNPGIVFPAALYADGEAQCSATLVGPDALLTALHCVKLAARSGSPMRIEFAGRSAQAECEAAPSRDAALCKVSPLVQRIAFDAIARKPVAPQDRVILTGWAEPAVSGMAASLRALVRRAAGGRTFRVGTGTVQFVGPLIAVEGAMTATGPVFADPGDSGGA